jgi:hypothetical protein
MTLTKYKKAVVLNPRISVMQRPRCSVLTSCLMKGFFSPRPLFLIEVERSQGRRPHTCDRAALCCKPPQQRILMWAQETIVHTIMRSPHHVNKAQRFSLSIPLFAHIALPFHLSVCFPLFFFSQSLFQAVFFVIYVMCSFSIRHPSVTFHSFILTRLKYMPSETVSQQCLSQPV